MKTNPARLIPAGIAVAGLAALAWFAGCSDGSAPACCDPPPPEGVIVSNPVPGTALGAETRGALALAPGAADDVAYVSLAPGTVPSGSRASVRRVGDASSLTTAVNDGGFDPVPVTAQAGDSIDITVTDAGGSTVYHARAAVLAARPPVIVRTEPPPRKRDVPLNASMMIVFSEPIDVGTLNLSSVHLLRGSTPVVGTVSLLAGSATATVFVPVVPLDANTDYRLVVTQAVRDLGGDALAADVTVEFTTGTASVGFAASVSVSPDSVEVLVGSQIQATATARDSLGMPVSGRPVTWRSADPAVATVSATGLVTAVAEGYIYIEAEIDGLADQVVLGVSVTPVQSVTVTPESARVALGRTFQLAAEIRDATGAILFLPRPTTWTSSDPTVAAVAQTNSMTVRVTGVGPGSAKILAAVEGKSDTAVVTVVSGPDTVLVSPTLASVVASKTVMLTATVHDAAGNPVDHPSVTWTSSAPGISTVAADSSGSTGLAFATVTGVSPGSITISATSGTESGTASVTVTPVSVVISPALASVAAGDTVMLTASVRDVAGNPLDHPSVTWTSDALGVAMVAADSSGSLGLAFATVTAVGEGSATITASIGGTSGSVSITVTPPRPVASVTVTPGAAPLLVRGTVTLTATLRDAQGKLIEGRPTTWASDNLAAATVDASGLVTGVGAGSASVSATSEGVRGASAVTVTALSFVSLSAGGSVTTVRLGPAGSYSVVRAHTCGVTTAGSMYCWGFNSFGQLGDGSTTSSAIPVAVAGGVAFSMVTVGTSHTCGLTHAGTAYCWGDNGVGQLGDGSTSSSSVPVAVNGGLTFSAVTTGSSHTCGLTISGIAYCWGSNRTGQFGDGSTISSSIPVVVGGGLTFSALSASGEYTCGLATNGAALCWGSNSAGQLGDGSTGSSSVPVAVTGGVTFSALSASGEHACGVATNGAAYCWGLNSSGQLGEGSTTSSSAPLAVAGGLTFSTLARGAAPPRAGNGGSPARTNTSTHTCGITTSGAAYCWGSGPLGNGSTGFAMVPLAVTGGLAFSALSASGVHTCGLTTDGVAYCWGNNTNGQLGIGTTISTEVPVKVLGQP